MSDKAEQLTSALLSLPEADRIALADLLYASIPDDKDTPLLAELDRRRAEHESGTDPDIPAREFFRRRREKRM